MKDQDKQMFAVLMNGLGAAFRTDTSKATMAVYFQYLSDYSIEAVRHAVDQTIKNGERFPVVKTLREFANAYRPPINRQPVTDAVQIAEFTETEIESSKQKLADIVNGLAQGMG